MAQTQTENVGIQTSDQQAEKTPQSTGPTVNVSQRSQSSRGVSPGGSSASSIRKAATPGLEHESLTKPQDPDYHSKVPFFLRMSGSITPRMLVPLAFVACWSTLITCISKFIHPLVADSLLLTVLGFVVGLGISFRTSSAYERWVEGRKYWQQLIQTSRDLARHIWIHVREEPSESGKAELLSKITALNLITAFAQSLKHRLRFEPYTHYDDLDPLVSHLDTFAATAFTSSPVLPKQRLSIWKRWGGYLGLTFAESDPRKIVKRSPAQLGNLPLEILTYLSSYHEHLIQSNLVDGTYSAMIATNIASMNDVLAGTERVLNTPLPMAYSIAISQITWVYVIALPFQLYKTLGWITIPGTIVGAYIILGIAAIGREIENPFGYDDNDLPLPHFVNQIENEIDVIRSRPKPDLKDWVKSAGNKLLFEWSYPVWETKSVGDIRKGLGVKAEQTGRLNKAAAVAASTREVKNEEDEQKTRGGNGV